MKTIDIVLKSIVICLLTLSMFSCVKGTNGDSLKLDKVNLSINDYLNKNHSFSILVEALNKTGLSDKLNLYGNMTLFAPTDDAFKKFFKRKGISGLSEMNTDTLRNLLKYHLYNQTFRSSLFQTGSLPAVTVSGDLIKMDISNGIRNTYLNNSVKIDSLDRDVSNGVVHIIADVLEPPSNTIYSYMTGNPKYSIMAEAIHKTGLDTAVLNKIYYDDGLIINGLPSKKWITVFFETNDVLKQSGINSFDDLAKQFSDTYNTSKAYSNLSDSLNIFMRYHCMQQRFFISDFRADYFETISPGNWLIFDTDGGLNINKRNNIKVNINLETSNQVANNGIIHSIGSVLSLYNPDPIKVNCYFGGAPSDRVITLLSGKVTDFKTQFANGSLNNDPQAQSVVWWLKWGYTSGTPSITGVGTPSNNDVNPLYTSDFPMETMDGIKVASSVGLWLELTTKPIFKGKYSLYLVEKKSNSNIGAQQHKFLWSFDDVQFPDMVDQMNGKDAFGNDVRLTLTGTNNNVWTNYFGVAIRKLGVFTFNTIASHKIKFVLVDDLRSQEWLKVMFVPSL